MRGVHHSHRRIEDNTCCIRSAFPILYFILLMLRLLFPVCCCSTGCYVYGRAFNPTVRELSKQLAAVEDMEVGRGVGPAC
jgi:hypothetical protein